MASARHGSSSRYVGKHFKENLPRSGAPQAGTEEWDTAAGLSQPGESRTTPAVETDMTINDRRSSVAKSTATMSLATLTSRATGFLRTWACAFALGNTVVNSAYQVANTLPNTLYELVAGGILATAFLPVLMSQRAKGDERQGNRYASNLLSIGIVFLGIIALLATLFAPQIIATQTFIDPNGTVVDDAVFFFRFFAIQILFYGIGGIVQGMLNSHKRFFWPSFAPVFNNVIVIITMFSYVPLYQSNPGLARIWLAVGTSAGVLAQVVVQMPQLRSIHFHYHFHIDFSDPAIRETARLAVPAIVLGIINLVCVSVRNAFALGVSDNGASTLSYAWIWFQLPYGVLAVALSTAMFTEMSSDAAKGDWGTFRKDVRSGLQGTFFLIIPMAVQLICCASLLVALYHAGKFTADDIAIVSSVLIWWAVTLPLYAGYRFLHFAFSARRELMTVAKVSIWTSLLQVVLYWVLPLGIGGFEGIGLIGIPIADGIFLILNFTILLVILRQRIGHFQLKATAVVCGKTLVASLAGAAVTLLLRHLMGDTVSIAYSIVQLVVAGGSGLVVTFLFCALMKVDEMDILKRLLRRFSRRKA